MRASLSFVLCLVPAFSGKTVAAPLPERPGPRLELRLRTTEPIVKPGQEIRWQVSIVNRGTEPVTLVHPGDGSDCGWRTPIIEWVINGRVEGAGLQNLIAKPEQKRAEPAPPEKKPELVPACLSGKGSGIARCGTGTWHEPAPWCPRPDQQKCAARG